MEMKMKMALERAAREEAYMHTLPCMQEPKQVQAVVIVHGWKRCVAGWIKYIHTYMPKAVGDTEL